MARLNDLIDSEAGIAAIARAAAASGDPREIAATQARITRSILEHCKMRVETADAAVA